MALCGAAPTFQGESMKTVAGIVLIILGIVLGVYLGVWVFFIGGIVDVVNAFKADSFPALAFAIGVAKILLAQAVGMITFATCGFIGSRML